MTHVAVDPGRAGLKRLAGAGRPVPCPASGALRAARGWADAAAVEARAAGCVAWVRRDVPDVSGLALVAPGEAAARELEAALTRAAPGLAVIALPAPLATAVALTDAPPGDGAVDAVLDLGHDALRLALVRWHRLGDEAFPRLEAEGLERPLGGARLDQALLAAASVDGDPAAAPAFELKELVAAGRGPWVRAWPGGPGAPPVVARLAAGAGARAVAAFAREVEAALPALAERAVAGGARRALVTGGLALLPPVRAAVVAALTRAGLSVVAAPDPLFTASRGALRALARPVAPTAATALRVVVRDGRGAAAREVVPRGAVLPGRFGPVRLRAARPGADAAVQVLEGERLLEVRLPLGEAPGDVWFAWSFGRGWSVQVGEGEGKPLSPAAAATSQAVRDALAFDWAGHSQPVPIDLALVFRATQGGGDAVLRPMGEALAAMATAVITAAPDVRLRAIAVGDHPQGHLRPAYVTKVQPAWVTRVDELAAFVRERLAAPVDGIDAPEAYEVGLKDAAGLDWRPDAEKLVVVVADVPPHVPEEPPFCPVDWRVEVKRLREKGVRLVPVHLALSGVTPQLRRAALAFLEGLGDKVEALRSATPGPTLVATLQAAAATRRMDPAARRVLEAIGAALA